MKLPQGVNEFISRQLPQPISFDTPEQVRETYDRVRNQTPLRPAIRAAYFLLNRYYDPHLTYEEGAGSDLERVKNDGNPHIYVYNHQNQDYLSVGAIQHKAIPYDVGRIRTLANDQTYNIPQIRPLAEAWGAIPVARKVDYKQTPEIAKATYEELFDCCVYLLHAGYPIGIYPEGDVNRHEPWLYPSFVDVAKHGTAVIAVRAATSDLPTAITPIGHTNGPGNLHKPKRGGVSGHIGRSIFVGPDDKIPDVTHRIRSSLTHCVTVASATR